MDLVVVESPTKARTLSKFLGKNYEVVASVGHVRDLPKSELGIDVEKNFEPKYVISPKAKKTVASLKSKSKGAKLVFLATDPDREGEAIAWHVLKVISDKSQKPQAKRVVFHEITKEAVEEAFKHTRGLDENLFNAQQARRVLDRIVGYKLSPLLWKKVRYGLSAGRVQSVAVRLVVEREEERLNFVPKEYWSIDAIFVTQKEENFTAGLFKISGKKADLKNKDQVEKVVAELSSGSKQLTVTSVEKSDKKRNPYPPFTTSTLQQAASNKLGFNAKRTMLAAQKLFEAGFITYHRTDSFSLSKAFLEKARKYIEKTHGKDFIPEKPNYYKNRSRNAQEAHEAIRPTDVFLERPDGVGEDEAKVYNLIQKRAVSSQMLPAIYEQVTVLTDSSDKKYQFKALGSTLLFEGWLKVYGFDLDEENADTKESSMPNLNEKDLVNLLELKPMQHFTEASGRYTEATLIKALEENGIGRPSTYAPTISTILDRGYVAKDGKYLFPLDVGNVVTHLLVDHFPKIMDYEFTARIEEELDEIAEGKAKWVSVIKEFYEPFMKELENKEGELSKKDMTVLEELDEKCPDCGKMLQVKLGKFGRFISCSGFPDCKYARTVPTGLSSTSSWNPEGDRISGAEPSIDESQLGKCSSCENGNLMLKDGRFGKFIACSNYPKCKFTKPYLEKIGMKCPLCNHGEVVAKKGRRFKRVFYGCSRYPDCKFVSNKNPMQDPQPKKEAGG